MNSKYWIEHLQLLPHPEGGYYKETYRSAEKIMASGLDGKRNISTAIYFLLDGKNKSHLHRIKSDELWFFHEGATLEIFCLSEKGLVTILLGKDIEGGEVLQAIVPAGIWFGAKVKDEKNYALVSCTVAPGFDFQDFELAKKEYLLNHFPEHKELIETMSLT
ncbi:MAG TPA: cupin domain-containing protein [Cytophagaceae bacterium]|jgi:predicted cupin superfamily sugar epimerase|nr:cupin domain-containing protein [Cytophagaceae bacterium]